VALFETATVTQPRGDAPAPLLPVDRRPTEGEWDDLQKALPEQPLHLALVLTGERERSGWWGPGRRAAWSDAVETVRQVLTLLEEQYVVVGLLRAALTDHEGLNVAIGAEHGVESLADCSLVVAPYLAGGATAGSIAVLGPTRMKYPQAMAVVNAVSERLGRLLTEG
jgi:hypothetical protein